jgi:hypothetical protein
MTRNTALTALSVMALGLMLAEDVVAAPSSSCFEYDGRCYVTAAEVCAVVARARHEDSSFEYPYDRVLTSKEDGDSVSCKLGNKLGNEVEFDYGNKVTVAEEPKAANAAAGASVHPSVIQDIESKFTQLYAKLSPKARYRLNRNITIAIGVVTEKSDKEANEPRFVYTLSGNASSKDIDAAADELGLARWKPSARAEGRGAVGAPNDAEQLLTEGAETNHFDVWAMGVNRRVCADCAVHVKDAEIPTHAFPDGAFRKGGPLYKYQPPAGGGGEEAGR